MENIPEGCKLIAVLDGAGHSATWTLCVEDMDGEVVAYLEWPKGWPEKVPMAKLQAAGFNCQVA